MIRLSIVIATVALVLVALIAYDHYRQPADRVSGFVEADEIRVGSRLGGRVATVHVEEGQRVEAGQVLVELEPFDLLQREQEALGRLQALDAAYRRLAEGLRDEEIAQAEARYDQFKARLDLLEAGPRAQEVEAAQGRLGVAEAELTLARRNHERIAAMLERGAVAPDALDAAGEKLDVARATVVVRTEELDLLKAGAREEEKREARARVEEAHQAWLLAKKGYREQEIEEAGAARAAAEAALDVIREQKKELSITSPIDGIVEALDLQGGDLVAAGAPILSIMDDSHMWVRAYVPQNRVGVRVGERLRVTVDALGEGFVGEVTFVSRQAEFTPSNVQTPEERSKQVFRVKVALRSGLDRVRPGMTADVWLDREDAGRE